MQLGVDYYPEHWDPARWPIDARMMREARLEIVRLAEFAWTKLEPREGEFDSAWLDRAIEILAAEGLKIILGTPTAAPPAWLVRAHPDVLPVDAQGRRREFGSRCHYCHTNAMYRQHTRRVLQEMGTRYGQNPVVIGWQLDNEFGNHESARCYCDECAAGFRGWLKARYGTLDALNAAWGNVFWSQTYTDWDQINPPRLTMTEANPSHALDYERFSSDSMVEYEKLQVDILRPLVGNQFITTNLMGDFSDLDYHKLAAPLDFVTWDNYPTGHAERRGHALYLPDAPRPELAYDVGNPYMTGFCHALIRGLKPGAPFWTMEQQCGNVNWGTYNPAPRPGVMRLWTWHTFAAGGDAVVYFRWRACLFAQEQYHSGLLRHDGEPAQGYRDLLAMKSDRKLMDHLRGTRVQNEVALLASYEDLWAVGLQPHNQDLTYWRHLFAYYTALQRAGVPCDIISPRSDLEPYKLVIAPTLFLCDDSLATHLETYARAGGTLMLGIRSGFKTPSNVVTDKPLPGALRALVGATLQSWQSLPPEIELRLVLSWRAGEMTGARHWAEVLLPDTAHAIATYTEGHLQGQAAATFNPVRNGQVVYIGWLPDEAQADALIGMLLPQAGVEPLAMLPPGVVVTRRVGTQGTFTFLLNFTDAPAVAWLNVPAQIDAATGQIVGKEVTVAPRDVRILMNSDSSDTDSR